MLCWQYPGRVAWLHSALLVSWTTKDKTSEGSKPAAGILPGKGTFRRNLVLPFICEVFVWGRGLGANHSMSRGVSEICSESSASDAKCEPL